jgi:Ig-like domain from next to BRCA1 gene
MSPNPVLPVKKALFVLLSLAVVLSACNLPRGTPTLSEMDVISTQAAETVAAQLTEISKPPATVGPGTPTSVFSTQLPTYGTPSATLLPTYPSGQFPSATPPPPNQTPSACDDAKFGTDVSVPDNTEFAPGAPFTKTWRLRNVGTCTWTTSYSIVFSGGDKMGAPDVLPMPATVYPGNAIDISIPMVAPSAPGTYRGEWKLRNASNQVFGLGDQNKPFWVQIKVVSSQPSTMDFLSLAKSAAWTSGVGTNPGTPLPYNGSDTDPNGTVKIVQGVQLEDGQVSGKILLTYPRREDNGYIAGVYPSYQVQPGNHLKARLAFIANSDGNCGAGNVTFLIGYLDNGALKSLGEWNKTCTGQQQPIDVDLVNLVGKSVQFIVGVRANGAAVDDWAIWNSLRIQ